MDKLSTIRVLFRSPETLALYGIPYEMRADVGQEPRHLWQSTSIPDAVAEARGIIGARITTPGPRADWIMLDERSPEVQAFLADKDVPGYPYEWSRVV